MDSLNKTFLPTRSYKNRDWFIIDCKDQSLGRLATAITTLLKGKIKTHYHPSIDTGNHIILINASKIIMNKDRQNYFVYNPGRPGHSLKIRSVSNCLPELTVKKAIKGMLSKTEKKRLIRRVIVCNDSKHSYQAQKPTKVNLSDFYPTI